MPYAPAPSPAFRGGSPYPPVTPEQIAEAERRRAEAEAKKYADLDADRQRALGLYEQFLAERATPDYVPERVLGETVEAASVGPAPTVEMRAPSPVERVTAGQVAAPQDVALRQAAPVETVAAERVAAPQLGVAQTVAAQTVGDSEFRGNQAAYVDMLEQAAIGNAPSVAVAKYQQRQKQIEDEQLGLAGQARGNDRLFARRQAMRNISEGQRAAAADEALARATEITGARQALGSAIEGARGQDLAQGTTNAQLSLDAGKFSAGATNERDAYRAQLEADVARDNANRELAADTTSAAARNEREQFLTEADLRRQEGNVTRRTAVETGNVDRTTAVDTRNADANDARQIDITKTKAAIDAGNADRTLQGRTSDATLKQDAAKTTAGFRQDAATQNQQAGIQAAQVNNQQDASLRGDALQASGLASQSTGQKTQAQIERERVAADVKARKDASNKGMMGGLISGLATVGGAAITKSDERAKTAVRPESRAAEDEFLDALEAYSYRYKNPSDGQGQRHGPMAQDLERTEIGRDLVRDLDDGDKGVELDELTLAMAGMLGRLHDRVKRVEGRR